MKTYVIGVGGVGGFFGGLLAKYDVTVTLVAHPGNHVDAIQKNNGLQVTSTVGNFFIPGNKIIDNIGKISNPELIIVAVKTYDTETTMNKLQEVISDKTIIITFQNGIDNDERIKNFITKTNRIFPGVAYVISGIQEAGVVSQTAGAKKLIIGDRNNPTNPLLQEVQKYISLAGVDITVSDDISRDVWKKYLFILPSAGLTAMYQIPLGDILNDGTKRKQYEDCIYEGIKVATAAQIQLPDDIFDVTMKTSLITDPKATTSLARDVANHRRNEIETLHGTLIRFAKQYTIEVPVNELIYNTIRQQYV